MAFLLMVFIARQLNPLVAQAAYRELSFCKCLYTVLLQAIQGSNENFFGVSISNHFRSGLDRLQQPPGG